MILLFNSKREIQIPNLQRKDLVDEKAQTILLQTVYPEVVSFLKRSIGNEGCKQVLREIGASVAKTVSEYWLPKAKNIQDMVKEIFKKILDNKGIKIIKEKGRNFIVKDFECRLCWEGVEEEDINYCISTSAFIEEIINFIRKSFVFLPRVKVSTIQSRAAGADHCEHLIEFL
ncbi:MAG: hypothetical protein HWN67_14795 [Candidatus Helarchaeota archaeon]|nr:hypothetical protein [Candidatus Helarchaeota archaeon]